MRDGALDSDHLTNSPLFTPEVADVKARAGALGTW